MEIAFSVNIPHQYDTTNPDAKFLLASPPGSQRRLLVYQARGARRKFRTAVTVQEDGHPESFVGGVALYLEITQDVVIPLYTTQDPQPTKWDIAVHYDRGGEQILYAFQTKDQALAFQELITGYDVAECFQDVEVVALHHHDEREAPWYKPWKKVSCKPELRGRGEVQIWRKRSRPTGASPAGDSMDARVDTGSVRSGPRRTSTAPLSPRPRQGDTVSVVANHNGQRAYVAASPDPPVLVAFLRSGDEHIMLQVDLSETEGSVTGSMLHLFCETSGTPFSVKKVAATENTKATWDICKLGILAKKPGAEILRCNYLTFETQCPYSGRTQTVPRQADPHTLRQRAQDAKALSRSIVESKVEYEWADLERVCGRTYARNNRVPLSVQKPNDTPSPSTSARAVNGSGSINRNSNGTGAERVSSIASLPETFRAPNQQPAELEASPEAQIRPEPKAIPALIRRKELNPISQPKPRRPLDEGLGLGLASSPGPSDRPLPRYAVLDGESA